MVDSSSCGLTAPPPRSARRPSSGDVRPACTARVSRRPRRTAAVWAVAVTLLTGLLIGLLDGSAVSARLSAPPGGLAERLSSEGTPPAKQNAAPWIEKKAGKQAGPAEENVHTAHAGESDFGDSSGTEDEFIAAGTARLGPRGQSIVPATGFPRSTGTSPDTGSARGPPLRPGRPHAGVQRSRRLRSTATGADPPCPREDSAHEQLPFTDP